MSIKERILAKREERRKAKLEAAYAKYLSFAKLVAGDKYKNDASEIIKKARKLEMEVLGEAITSRLVYDNAYYELADSIKKLYDIKHKEEMTYIELICEKGLSIEKQGIASSTHSEVNKYLEDNLNKAMTATRNCEFARMKKNLEYPSSCR